MTNPDFFGQPTAKSSQVGERPAIFPASEGSLFAGLVSLIVALAVIGTALLFSDSRISGLLSAVAPILLHTIFCRVAGVRQSTPSVSLLFGISYLVFFGSGYLLLISNQQRLAFRPGFVPLATANAALASTALITVFLCVGSWLTIGRTRNRSISRSDIPRFDQAFAILAFILFMLAIVGAAGTIAGYGSISATIEAFTIHDRNNTLGLADSSFFRSWSVFSLPAIIALEVCIVSFRTRVARVLSALALSTLLVVGLVVFTSRLVIILALVAYVAVLFKGTGRLIPGYAAAAAAVLFVAVSFVLVSQRPGGLDLQRVTLFQRLLQILNYGIVDVGMSSSANSQALSGLFRSPTRILTLLESALPGFGPNQDSISKARVDVIVARTVGSAAQGNDSALPPSMPFYILIGFGAVAGCLVATLLGIVASRTFSLLLKSNGHIWTFFFAFYFAFLFNTFKGGDLALDLASEARRVAYVLVLYAVVAMCLQARRPAFKNSADQYMGADK